MPSPPYFIGDTDTMYCLFENTVLGWLVSIISYYACDWHYVVNILVFGIFFGFS